MRYLLILLLLSSCIGYKTKYRLKPITYYKDSVLTRDYMLEILYHDRFIGGWESTLVEPELLLPEERVIYDSLRRK